MRICGGEAVWYLKRGTLLSVGWQKHAHNMYFKASCTPIAKYMKTIAKNAKCVAGYFANVFAKHITIYETLTIHFLYFMWIFVLLMLRKNIPQNPLTFCANVNPGAKCRKRKKGRKMQKSWRKVSRYTLFCFSHLAIVFAYFAISV